jgi:hypothetical protein
MVFIQMKLDEGGSSVEGFVTSIQEEGGHIFLRVEGLVADAPGTAGRRHV